MRKEEYTPDVGQRSASETTIRAMIEDYRQSTPTLIRRVMEMTEVEAVSSYEALYGRIA